jgi:hypothetical protein
MPIGQQGHPNRLDGIGLTHHYFSGFAEEFPVEALESVNRFSVRSKFQIHAAI